MNTKDPSVEGTREIAAPAAGVASGDWLAKLNFPDWPELKAAMQLPLPIFLRKVQDDLRLCAEHQNSEDANWIAENIYTLAKEHLESAGYEPGVVRALLANAEVRHETSANDNAA